MCDGSRKPIVDVAEGEWVLARDSETGALECRQVVDPYANPDRAIVELELVDEAGLSEVIETTNNHPFWVENQGWTRVDHLQAGDQIPSGTGATLVVASVYQTERVETVYNFGVDEFRSYFVGESGAWVHNCFGKIKNLRGKSLKYIKRNKPKGWRTKKTDSGSGWKWEDKNGVERLRFMRP